jgi:hypothetical protein
MSREIEHLALFICFNCSCKESLHIGRILVKLTRK